MRAYIFVLATVVMTLAVSPAPATLTGMYWTEYHSSGSPISRIQRAKLDGTGVEELVTALQTPVSIAVDAAGGKMYWTDVGTHKIERSNLDGTGIEDLVTGLDSPFMALP